LNHSPAPSMFDSPGTILATIAGVLVVGLVLLRVAVAWYASRFASRTPYFDGERSFVEGDGTARFPSVFERASLDLSIVVPAYNEEKRLPVMLRETVDYIQARKRAQPEFTCEIIIVDDGSRDNTSQVALRYSAKYGTDLIRVMQLRRNVGKGGAVRKGALCARGRLILMADADAATDIRDVERLETALRRVAMPSGMPVDQQFAVAVGSRAHLEQEAVAKRKCHRNLLMHAFHLFVVFVGGVRGLRDTQCGFKLFTRDSARRLFTSLHIERWAFDVELLYVAQRLGMPCTEVAVNWHEVDGSKLDLLSASVTMARDMFVVRLCYVLGVWRPSSPTEKLE